MRVVYVCVMLFFQLCKLVVLRGDMLRVDVSECVHIMQNDYLCRVNREFVCELMKRLEFIPQKSVVNKSYMLWKIVLKFVPIFSWKLHFTHREHVVIIYTTKIES